MLAVRMFEALTRYYTACDALPLVHDTCLDHMMCFLSTMDEMNTLWCEGLVAPEAIAAQPFHCRPKMHMVSHLVLDQLLLWGSPHNFSCYLDEHYIGAMTLVCARSKHPRTIEQVPMEKSRILAGVQEEMMRRVYEL